MPILSHVARAVSTGLLGLAALAATPVLAGPASPYFGRWTLADPKPHYTARAAEYRTIDIAPCGKDFCGVSVGPKGACGAVLFRLLAKHLPGDDMITAHAKWGNDKLKMMIEPDKGNVFTFFIGLGDRRYEMESRSSSMPKFDGQYTSAGAASCTTK
jgi:hypothetical protein